MSGLERLDEAINAYEQWGLVGFYDFAENNYNGTVALFAAARAYRDLLADGHYHVIEGGFIIHKNHGLGAEAKALDSIPFEGHQHLVVLMERNYVNEVSGPALSVYPKEAENVILDIRCRNCAHGKVWHQDEGRCYFDHECDCEVWIYGVNVDKFDAGEQMHHQYAAELKEAGWIVLHESDFTVDSFHTDPYFHAVVTRIARWYENPTDPPDPEELARLIDAMKTSLGS